MLARLMIVPVAFLIKGNFPMLTIFLFLNLLDISKVKYKGMVGSICSHWTVNRGGYKQNSSPCISS